MSREEILIAKIKEASEAYYTTGKSDLSDKEFDNLVEELEQINPNAEILNKREIHNDDWNYQLESLPYKLYSIKKVKTWKEIQNWIDFICKKIGISNNDKGRINIILTPKYDGIKILHNDNKFFTRYETGEQGYNVTKRIKSSILGKENLGVEGELIISKSNFKKYCFGYNSSRNFIPAIFSSKEKLSIQDKVEYIRYSVYGEEESQMSKEEQLNYCNKFNNIKVPYLKIAYKDLTEDKIIKFYFDNVSDYEYDGVVIDIDSELIRRELGETQKYLDCCRAYKGDALFDDIKESKIEDVIWQMSRYGKLTPVAKITPVIINEGVVSNVSLYNAAYVFDTNVFIGQTIKVTRKGKINPKIIDFEPIGNINTSSYHNANIVPIICPFCGGALEWSENDKGEMVDLVCNNDNCLEKKIQQIYFFLKTIGIKEFGLKTIKNILLFDNNLSIIDFIDENKFSKLPIIGLQGIGIKTKDLFLSQLNNIKKEGLTLEVLQEASGLFQGMSQSTLKILNTLNIDMEFYFNDRYYNEIYQKGLSLEGIGELTLKDYLNGLYKFYKEGFWDSIKNIFIIKKKNKQGNLFLNKNICFTGFRNKDWEDIIVNNGGKILSSVTSNCNLLVVKDINSVSSKMQKAKQMGIKILSIEEFDKLIQK